MATLTFPQITLSPNILERLSQKAACSGKSLKAYIEGILSDNAKEAHRHLATLGLTIQRIFVW